MYNRKESNFKEFLRIRSNTSLGTHTLGC